MKIQQVEIIHIQVMVMDQTTVMQHIQTYVELIYMKQVMEYVLRYEHDIIQQQIQMKEVYVLQQYQTVIIYLMEVEQTHVVGNVIPTIH
jgi:hypothetical protein